MLELSSNKIKALGIFGRLSGDQEAYFDRLEETYSNKKDTNSDYSIFRHLTLTFLQDASVENIREQLDILSDLRSFLPLKIKVKRSFVKDEESMKGAEHIAIEFELDQTKEILDYIKKRVPEQHVVATWYTKVVWFVPKENQQAVIDELSEFKELEFTDFYLVSNKQDEANTIYTSNRFNRNS